MKEGAAQIDNVILTWALIMGLGFSPTKASLKRLVWCHVLLCCFPLSE